MGAEANTTPAGEEDFQLSVADGTLLDDIILRPRRALKHMLSLDVSKATGPDAMPARILKGIAHEIYMIFAILCRRILNEAH